MYNELRTVAFQFAPHVETLEREFYTLSFPEHWKPLLRDLQAETKKRNYDKKKLRIPIKNLNQALRALVPDLISIVPNADKPDKLWLYSAKPVNEGALYLIIKAWVKTSFSQAPVESRNRVLLQLKQDDLQWQLKSVDLAKWNTHANGTAKPHDNDVFTILPDYLATRLSQPHVKFDIQSNLVHFRRSPLAPGGRGAELVSWPPILEPEPWSFLLKLTVQTVPFQNFPVIYCECGVRRWVGSTPYRVGGGQTSVALLTTVPWLPELPYTSSFQVAPIKWKKASGKKEGFYLIWGNKLVDLLNELQLQHPFPNAQDIVDSPEVAMNLKGTPNAVIFYRTGMKPDHEVKAGLRVGDRKTIAEQLAEKFRPHFIFTDPLPRLTHPSSKTSKMKNYTSPKLENPFLVSEQQVSDSSFVQRRQAIGKTVDGKLIVEIRYQSSTVRDALVKAISEVLGFPEPQKLPHTWHTPDLTLTVTANYLGAIGELLELDSNIKGKKDRLQKSINQRIKKITKEIDSTKEIKATLVELDNYSDKDKDRDPKAAIRLGFAHTNRITQFITPLQDFKSSKQEEKVRKNLAHRARASFLDLLRQLGVQVNNQNKKLLDELPEKLNYVGLWLIKQNAPSSATRTRDILPVIVYMNSYSTDIKVKAAGFTDWLPYHEALLAIAQGQAKGFDKTWKALPFIEKHLQEIMGLGDTVLLCHSQNLRQTWKWLQDMRITIDSLQINNSKIQSITNWKGLRVVRIRNNQGNETPEWYGQDEDRAGLPKGLFKVGDRVFASTHGKSGKFQTPLHVSKIDLPHKPAWNPGLFELTVACIQPGDEAWLWAAVTHELRNMALNSDEATALPLPLHLAKQMKEYTLPLMDDYEDD